MAGPNYISYTDWEVQEMGHRKRRQRWIVVVLGALAAAALALTIPMAANKISKTDIPVGSGMSGGAYEENSSEDSQERTKLRGQASPRSFSTGVRFSR